MTNWWALALTLAIGSLFAGISLIAADYPRTFFTLTPRESPAFYVYCLFYGALAVLAYLGFDALTQSGVLHLAGLGVENDWVRAIYLGLGARILLNLQLFELKTGPNDADKISTSPRIVLSRPLEWLLDLTRRDVKHGVTRYLDPFLAAYPDLDTVKRIARQQAASRLTMDFAGRQAFLLDIETWDTASVAFESFLVFLGRKNLEQAFPHGSRSAVSKP